jgi:hypothetical protein
MQSITLQLRASSMTDLEMFLVGKRNPEGKRITKRAVFQYLLDNFLKDDALKDAFLATPSKEYD